MSNAIVKRVQGDIIKIFISTHKHSRLFQIDFKDFTL